MPNTYRCPEMDQLSRELANAYRQVEVSDIKIPQNIAEIHQRVARHRKECPVCRIIFLRKQMDAVRTFMDEMIG